MKKLLAILLILGFLVGCGPIDPISPIVTGVVMWKEGEAHKYYPYEAGIVYRASKRALEDMEININKDEPEEGKYYINAGKEDRLKINIADAKKDISKLSVRINFMGDKPYAELFYQKVDEELSTVRFGPDGRPMLPEDE